MQSKSGERVVERVDHDIADEHDLGIRLAFGTQTGVRIARGREQQVGQAIGHEPIDLLGHRPVVAPKPRLDVRCAQPELRRNDGGRHRRVHVAVHEHPVGAMPFEHGLDALHDPGRLHGMRGAADGEVFVRLREPQTLEERVGHHLVVVLPRVHDHLRHAGGDPCPVHGGQFGEVRAGADDVEDLHGVSGVVAAAVAPLSMRSRSVRHQARRLATSFSKPNGPGSYRVVSAIASGR